MLKVIPSILLKTATTDLHMPLFTKFSEQCQIFYGLLLSTRLQWAYGASSFESTQFVPLYSGISNSNIKKRSMLNSN